jgi:hypothetical protein
VVRQRFKLFLVFQFRQRRDRLFWQLHNDLLIRAKIANKALPLNFSTSPATFFAITSVLPLQALAALSIVSLACATEVANIREVATAAAAAISAIRSAMLTMDRYYGLAKMAAMRRPSG